MSDSTSIEWADATWSPTVGCDKVSAGCTHCYAIRTAYRNAAIGQPAYQGLTKKLPDGSLNWTGVVRTLPERLQPPLTWKKPRRIFVDSMSDLFHDDVPNAFIAQVFAVMAMADWHTFQVLTKRPERMRALMNDAARDGFDGAVNDAGLDIVGPPWSFLKTQPAPDEPHNWPPRNVWLGVSVEDQRAADERIPLLLQTPAAIRFLSCEPLLGPLDLRTWMSRGMGCDGMCDEDAPGTCQRPEHRLRRPDWIIAGAESGPGARPMDEDWVRDLRDQCTAAGVAFFYKQNAVNGRKTHLPELDGKVWTEYPAPARELVHA